MMIRRTPRFAGPPNARDLMERADAPHAIAMTWAATLAEFFALCLLLLCFARVGGASDWTGRCVGLFGVAVCSAVLLRIGAWNS